MENLGEAEDSLDWNILFPKHISGNMEVFTIHNIFTISTKYIVLLARLFVKLNACTLYGWIQKVLEPTRTQNC